MKTFPRYFLVDGEIPVKIDEENGEVFAVNGFGNPYPIFKAVSNGLEVSQEDFNRAARALSAAE